jgi:hypothetical protein
MAAGDLGIGFADDIGDLKLRPGHGCCSPGALAAFAISRER